MAARFLRNRSWHSNMSVQLLLVYEVDVYILLCKVQVQGGLRLEVLLGGSVNLKVEGIR